MFNIDFDKILQLILPLQLRKDNFTAMMKAMLKPLKTIFAEMQSYRLSAIDIITHTGQVIYLEHILNKTFYPSWTPNVRIYITDSDDLRNNDILYNNSEGQTPIYMTNAAEHETEWYVGNKAEYDANTDFRVMIPIVISPEQPYVQAMVDRYRCAGKRYVIETYDPNS